MAEEHGFQEPGGHRLCVNNCGFFGSPATQNMCSKCYRNLCIKKSGESSLFSPPLATSLSTMAATSLVSAPEKVEVEPVVEAVVDDHAAAVGATTNRCSACRKKIGLTGFRCRCGSTFCGTHRYAEKHGCTFDFKAAGREEIAKANPLVKGKKLEKI